MTFSKIGLLIAIFSAGTAFADAPCESRLSQHETPVEEVWTQTFTDRQFSDIADLNGLIVWQLGEFVAKKKRLPIETELLGKLKKHLKRSPRETRTENNLLAQTIAHGLGFYFQQHGSFRSLHEALNRSQDLRPEALEPLRMAAKKHLVRLLRLTLFHPPLERLSQASGIELEVLKALIPSLRTFTDQTLQEDPQARHALRLRFMRGFVRAAQQKHLPDHARTQSRTPTLEELSQQLARELMVDQFDVQAWIHPNTGDLPQRPAPLFQNMAQLEEAVRQDLPGSLKNHYSQVHFGMEKAMEVLRTIENDPGFLVTSVTAGIPLDEEMYQLILQRAEDLGYKILVFPVNQVLEGLDPRLLENPRIQIVTNDIQNRHFKLWRIPIMAKNQNPFASIDQRRQTIPGQLVIVGHPQRAHEIVATSSNHIRETALWSTGSISKPYYPYRMPQQARTSALAKNYHTNAFLIVQKSDRTAGPLGEGAQNSWHVRNVDFFDDRAHNGEVGFYDFGEKYTIKNAQFSRELVGPKQMVVGDLHDHLALQTLLSAYREVLEMFPSIEDIYLHDPIDGWSHNRHEREMISLLIRKFERGELNLENEINGLVITINALLRLRESLRVVLPDSNHSYWLKNLIDKRTDSQSVINGRVLAELTHAIQVMGYSDPLEYVLNYRNSYVASLPAHVQQQFFERAIMVSDPRRVQVIPYGQPHVVGPIHRPVHLNFHGHQGANGQRGSTRAHSAASENAVTGDSHRSSIRGGNFNVGTSTPKRVGYNNGGYSAWTHSFDLVYDNGVIQKITFDALAQRFRPQNGEEPLPPDQFFGSDRLELLPTDNELLPGADVIDNYSWLSEP